MDEEPQKTTSLIEENSPKPAAYKTLYMPVVV
jgi:hypothetical protein